MQRQNMHNNINRNNHRNGDSRGNNRGRLPHQNQKGRCMLGARGCVPCCQPPWLAGAAAWRTEPPAQAVADPAGPPA
eukprot:365636-Chlamydomonas_euryale.AAC.5